MKNSNRILPFAFIGEKRGWSSPDGEKAPSGEIWDVYCLPGSIAASGKSFDEAAQMLQNMIDGAMLRFGDDGGWYDAMEKRMGEANRALFERVLVRHSSRMRKFSEEIRNRRNAIGEQSFEDEPAFCEHDINGVRELECVGGR